MNLAKGALTFLIGLFAVYFLVSLLHFTDMGSGSVCCAVLYLAAVVSFYASKIIAILKSPSANAVNHSEEQVDNQEINHN